jgi:hypothetical protein
MANAGRWMTCATSPAPMIPTRSLLSAILKRYELGNDVVRESEHLFTASSSLEFLCYCGPMLRSYAVGPQKFVYDFVIDRCNLTAPEC